MKLTIQFSPEEKKQPYQTLANLADDVWDDCQKSFEVRTLTRTDFRALLTPRTLIEARLAREKAEREAKESEESQLQQPKASMPSKDANSYTRTELYHMTEELLADALKMPADSYLKEDITAIEDFNLIIAGDQGELSHNERKLLLFLYRNYVINHYYGTQRPTKPHSKPDIVKSKLSRKGQRTLKWFPLDPEETLPAGIYRHIAIDMKIDDVPATAITAKAISTHMRNTYQEAYDACAETSKPGYELVSAVKRVLKQLVVAELLNSRKKRVQKADHKPNTSWYVDQYWIRK